MYLELKPTEQVQHFFQASKASTFLKFKIFFQRVVEEIMRSYDFSL